MEVGTGQEVCLGVLLDMCALFPTPSFNVSEPSV